MMISNKTKYLITIVTLIIIWILIAYQVPSLISHESNLGEIFGRYSLWYFVIILGYLFLLLIITIVSIWLIRANRADNFTERFGSYLSENLDNILIGFLIVWFLWIIVNEFFFVPAKISQGIFNALYGLSLSWILLYISLLTSLHARILSHILIPLGVFSFYSETLKYLLPDGVNKVFVTQSAMIFLPITIVLFIVFFAILNLRRIKIEFFRAAKEELHLRDLVLFLLPLTPVVQYMINNAEILSWFDHIVVFGIFFAFASLLIFIVPLLFKNTGSARPLMFLGMAFTFMITNMVSLTGHYMWYQEGSLKIQLIVFGGIWLISWTLSKMNLRSLLYLLIVVNFLSSSIVQLSNREGTKSPSTLDTSDNMLTTLVDSREPIITPSIYLLIYDAYVNNETMLAHGIDNIDQENYLEGLGFQIYPHTYSVKSTTIPTMSRVLNSSMSYYGSRRRAVSGDGVVQNLLEEFGYKTYGIFNWEFFFRGYIPSYDYWYPDASYSVSLLLAKAIFLGEFRFDIKFDPEPHEAFIDHREAFIIEKRKIFSEIPEEPRFVYMQTDWPGHSINAGVCRPNEIDLYSGRLTGANAEMRQDLALIIENNPEAILIVAGDHGPYLTKNCYDTEGEYDLSEITRLDIQDRNGTFLAIKWPTSDFEVYDEITVIQDLFPAIFAYIFKDQSLLNARIDPITDNGTTISGAEVSDGIIVGGINDGEPLYLLGEGD